MSRVGTTFSTMLVATDDSAEAKAAAGVAVALAERLGARIVFANVIDTQVIVDLEELAKQEAETLLAAAQQRASESGVVATTEILVGRLAPSVVSFARECGADLIVMGTRVRHGLERLLGSGTDGVLRSATIPVLVVPEACAENPVFAHLMVGVDDSEASDAAIELAIRYAHETQADLTFCTIVDPEAIVERAGTYGFDPAPLVDDARQRAERILTAAIAKVRHEHVRVHHLIFESRNATEGLLDAARQAGSDVIVLGTHGRRGLRHMLLGSVAEGVAGESDRPVLITHAVMEI